MKMIRFILAPMILLIVLQAIQFFVFFIIFDIKPFGIISHITSLFVHSLFGFSLYETAPRKKLILSSIYGAIYSLVMIGLALYNHGSRNIGDPSQIILFHPTYELVMIIGIIFGIRTARKAEHEKPRKNIN